VGVIVRPAAGLGVGSMAEVALGAAGMAASVLPALGEIRGRELRRAVSLPAQDRIYAALELDVGVRRFEDPHFPRVALPRSGDGRHRLRRGQSLG
jgi:ATP-binding cassette, subfamily B, bacterial